MNFLKRIANSSYVTTRFRWPSARVLHIYFWIVGLIGFGATVDSSIRTYHDAISKGAANPGMQTLVVTLLSVFAWSLVGLAYLAMLAFLYRVGTEIAAGFRRFRAWAPGAWQSTRKAAAAFGLFIASIPSLIGAFFRALGRAFMWIVGLPAWWRGLTGKQKRGVFWAVFVIGLYATTMYLFYPVARHIGSALPSWMAMSDVPLLQTLFLDFFLGSIIATFATAIASVVMALAAHLFSKH
jgi:hypothetical protein